MEPVDSARDVTKRSFEPLIISNPSLLDCCNCFQPLSIPVFQCDNGHIVCSTCCPKVRNKCPKCSLPISSKHCKAIENLLLSIEMSCPNTKYGCREKISYCRIRKHEEECIHEPCYCPHSGCDFVASSEVLSNHFSHKHGDSQIKFSYGHSFIVSLKSIDETIVLQEENYGELFILNNSITNLGNAVNICCIGPNSSEVEYNYDILARSHKGRLKLHSIATIVQRVTLATLSLEFLMIPIHSPKPLMLQVFMNTPKRPRMVGAPARVGLVAPIDVVVPPGNTGLDPSQTSVFSHEVLDITEDDLIAKFAIGVSMVTSLSLAISYPTLAAAPHMFVNAYKNVLAVAVATEYSADKVKEFLNDQSKFAVAAPAAASGGAPAAAKEEEKKPEPEEESDEEGILFCLVDDD